MSRLARAILARLDGVFDDPDLLSFGALSDTDMDIRRFCAETLADAPPVPSRHAEQARTRSLVIRYKDGGFIRYSETRKGWRGATASGIACSFNCLGVPNENCEALSIALDRAVTPGELREALKAHAYNGSDYSLI